MVGSVWKKHLVRWIPTQRVKRDVKTVNQLLQTRVRTKNDLKHFCLICEETRLVTCFVTWKSLKMRLTGLICSHWTSGCDILLLTTCSVSASLQSSVKFSIYLLQSVCNSFIFMLLYTLLHYREEYFMQLYLSMHVGSSCLTCQYFTHKINDLCIKYDPLLKVYYL